MTIEEMDKTKFSAGTKVSYKSEIFDIIAVDFSENLIGIGFAGNVDDPIQWVRCENVKIEYENQVKPVMNLL